MIKNGIIQSKDIYGIPFKSDLIPLTNKHARSTIKMQAKGITIHNTGNPNRAANAKMHTEYVDNQTEYVSWHFTVDCFRIYQELPINEIAWHAGDGRGPGNMTTISIEICENENWIKARQNGILLTVWLIENIFKDSSATKIVYPHKHWSGKDCPHLILREGWNKFVDEIDTMRQKLHNTHVEKKDKLTWKQILKKETLQSEDWESAILKAMELSSEHQELKIFQHADDLIQKLYYK